MGTETISVSTEGPLAVIKLNRPDALNALNSRMVRELSDALDALERDESVRCVILTGSERAFSAGADIKEMMKLSSADMIRTGHFFSFWTKVGFYPKPIIAALSGYVLGGGLELAMCCDILVASESAKLGQPEIGIGIIPGGGGTQRLARALGKYRAMELILSGGTIGAEEARARGLLNRVVPQAQLMDETKKLALEVASKPPLAVKLAKQAVNKSLEVGLTEGLDFERSLFYLLFSTEDMSEGMKAFLEKRKPEFKGR